MANWLQRLVSGLRARAEHVIETFIPSPRGKEEIAEIRERPEPPVEYEVPPEPVELGDLSDVDETSGESAMDFEGFFDEEEKEVDQDWEGYPIIEPSKDTRGPFLTRDEAEAYADEIPVPTTVGRSPFGLWIVRVDYP